MKYNVGNFINFKFFLISLSLGLFLNYINDPNQKIIYVYPTPDNVAQTQFKDHTDKCFSFKPLLVPCPKNEKEIENYTVE